MSDQTPPDTPQRGQSPCYLIPPQLSHLIEDRPLLWYEDADAYEVLLSSVFAELDPKGALEAILVKDVVDYIWEARRMRRLKAAAMHAELPGVASKVMGDAYEALHKLGYTSARQHLQNLMRGSAAGMEGWDEAALEAMEECKITPDVLLYEAYKSGLKTMSAINDELERLERRRDQILRWLREHRAALAAMARSLVAREEAEVVTANTAGRAA
jgi:hypothetical protein